MPLVFPHFILHTSIHFILPLHPVICSTHNHQEPGDEFMQLCSVSFSCPLVFMCMCYLYRHTVHRCARKGWAAHHELARRLSDSPSQDPLDVGLESFHLAHTILCKFGPQDKDFILSLFLVSASMQLCY